MTKKIKFLSTAFGLSSIDFLKKFKMEYFKIPSGEINNVLYLKKIGKLKKESNFIYRHVNYERNFLCS